MAPEIKRITCKKLAGLRLTMSFANNRTYELWSNFMPRRKEISNVSGDDMFSLQTYREDFFDSFDPKAGFEKWAAVEVTDFDTIPTDMEPFVLEGGLYAVFKYKGTPENAAGTFNYIFREWLPQSGYALDTRPHFELLGPKYKHGDPESEEEIWIPIK